MSLLCDGRRLKKKKTTIKRNTLNPTYNEAIIFDIPPENMDQVSLLISVMDYDRWVGVSAMPKSPLNSGWFFVPNSWCESVDYVIGLRYIKLQFLVFNQFFFEWAGHVPELPSSLGTVWLSSFEVPKSVDVWSKICCASNSTEGLWDSYASLDDRDIWERERERDSIFIYLL